MLFKLSWVSGSAHIPRADIVAKLHHIMQTSDKHMHALLIHQPVCFVSVQYDW